MTDWSLEDVPQIARRTLADGLDDQVGNNNIADESRVFAECPECAEPVQPESQ